MDADRRVLCAPEDLRLVPTALIHCANSTYGSPHSTQCKKETCPTSVWVKLSSKVVSVYSKNSNKVEASSLSG